MKRIALATLLLLAGILLQERVHAQTGIIPKPVNVRETGRTIDLPQSVVIWPTCSSAASNETDSPA